MVCDGIQYSNRPDCNYEAGKPECKIVLPRNFQFKTGRKDCTELGELPYVTTKHEEHPWAHGDGKMTTDFFAKNFDFSGRESVTIMGSHTVGRFNAHISLLPYVWTTKGEVSFNNHYYK